MKNILIIIGLTLSLTSFAQEQVKVTVCEKSEPTINIQHLLECKLLSTDNPEYKVISFSIGFVHDENYTEVTMTDNSLSERAIELLNKYNPDMLYIEHIVLINKKGEKLTLKSIKVKK